MALMNFTTASRSALLSWRKRSMAETLDGPAGVALGGAVPHDGLDDVAGAAVVQADGVAVFKTDWSPRAMLTVSI